VLSTVDRRGSFLFRIFLIFSADGSRVVAVIDVVVVTAASFLLFLVVVTENVDNFFRLIFDDLIGRRHDVDHTHRFGHRRCWRRSNIFAFGSFRR